MNYLVIYPGRFHPFHLGHKASYDWLAQKFGENTVHVVSSDKQNDEDSPFAYTDKVKMATKLGIPAGHIHKVKNPYQATEILSGLSDEEKTNTVLIFAVSDKDARRFDFKPKANGSPSYLQPLPVNKKAIKPMTQHGYVTVTPTVNFRVQGQDANSASQIRKLYMAGNDNDRNQIIVDLYGSADPELRDIFDRRLGVNTAQEDITYGQERVYAGDQPASIMREERLACLRENIVFLKDRIRQLRHGRDYVDEKITVARKKDTLYNR